VNTVEAVEGGVRLQVRVQPRASRSELAGLHAGRLRIRLAAPPVDGEANEELERFLARLLSVPRRAVNLTAGHSGRQKTLMIHGVTAADARTALGLG
jgi:uncharacterized protein (TIGR00251 family)